jgi:hypothetical protein
VQHYTLIGCLLNFTGQKISETIHRKVQREINVKQTHRNVFECRSEHQRVSQIAMNCQCTNSFKRPSALKLGRRVAYTALYQTSRLYAGMPPINQHLQQSPHSVLVSFRVNKRAVLIVLIELLDGAVVRFVHSRLVSHSFRTSMDSLVYRISLYTATFASCGIRKPRIRHACVKLVQRRNGYQLWCCRCC